MAKATVVTLQRLTLFKQLQDQLNENKFLGIHGTADDTLKLKTAVNIDGVSFDGSQDITLPNKVEHIYSKVDGETTSFYTTAESTVAVTGSTTAAYIDMNTGRAVYFDGTKFNYVIGEDDVERIAATEKGAANGVATLGSDTKVPASQLPSYVDDVIEVYTKTEGDVTTFYSDAEKTKAITEGEGGKIYIDVEATVDGSYRWSGTRFVAIGTKVSTADRAISDEDGRGIKATYVEKEDNKSLMTAQEHTDLATVVSNFPEEVTEDQIRALFA